MHNEFLRILTDYIHTAFAILVDTFFRFFRHLHQLEEMLRRSGIGVSVLVPPFQYALVRVIVASAINNDTSLFHPIGQILVRFRVKRFHVGVSHQQYFHILPRIGITGVFQVRDAYRYTPLQQRKSQAEEVG